MLRQGESHASRGVTISHACTITRGTSNRLRATAPTGERSKNDAVRRRKGISCTASAKSLGRFRQIVRSRPVRAVPPPTVFRLGPRHRNAPFCHMPHELSSHWTAGGPSRAARREGIPKRAQSDILGPSRSPNLAGSLSQKCIKLIFLSKSTIHFVREPLPVRFGADEKDLRARRAQSRPTCGPGA